MSDDTTRPTDETQPVRPEGAALPAPPADPEPADPEPADPEPAPLARRGLRERLRSLRRSEGENRFGLAALLASALAGIIVGGLGLTAVHAITEGGGRDHGGISQRRDGDGPGGRGGLHGGPAGQLPPTTVPDDEDSAG